MTKLAITAVSIALLCASGLAQAGSHEDPQAQIEKLEQDKKVLATRLRNAIAVSKERAAQLKTADETREHMSTGITSAIAQSKRKAAQSRMLQQQLDSAQNKNKALGNRLRNAIAVSKERGAMLEQLDSLKGKNKVLANRLRNAIAVSKDRAALQPQLASAQNKNKVLANRLRNAIAVSKERGAMLEQLDSLKGKNKVLANRLRNAIAVSKDRAALQPQLASAQNKNKALANRLRNAIAFSKERASESSMQADEGKQSGWADSVSAKLDATIGGVQGTSINTGADDSVLIAVGNNGLFRTGSTALSDTGTQLLALIATELAETDANITVVGHTDNVRVGENSSFSSNQELSLARAESTLQFLLDQGIPSESLTASGFGADNPIASNDTAEGRQQNRRVEIVLRQQ